MDVGSDSVMKQNREKKTENNESSGLDLGVREDSQEEQSSEQRLY